MSSSRMVYLAGLVGLYVAGVAVAAFALYGCGEDPDRIYSQAVGYKCVNDDSSIGDRLCKTRPAGRGQAEVSRYCYKTLADANCFDQPDPDRKNQALGSSGY